MWFPHQLTMRGSANEPPDQMYIPHSPGVCNLRTAPADLLKGCSCPSAPLPALGRSIATEADQDCVPPIRSETHQPEGCQVQARGKQVPINGPILVAQIQVLQKLQHKKRARVGRASLHLAGIQSPHPAGAKDLPLTQPSQEVLVTTGLAGCSCGFSPRECGIEVVADGAADHYIQAQSVSEREPLHQDAGENVLHFDHRQAKHDGTFAHSVCVGNRQLIPASEMVKSGRKISLKQTLLVE